MKKVKLMLLSLAGIFILPAVSFSEVGPLSETVMSLGPRAAYFKAKDATDGNWYYGAQFRLKLLPVLGVEGSVDYYEQTLFSQSLLGASAVVKSRTIPVQASALVYLMPGSSISPFLLGGFGWYHSTLITELNLPILGASSSSETKTRFGTHLGLGLEAKVSEYISLDATWRNIWLEKLTSSNANVADKEYDDSGYSVTIALNVLFGGTTD
jgi:opacity protein-like surface antigen